jgi:hypothetical protein
LKDKYVSGVQRVKSHSTTDGRLQPIQSFLEKVPKKGWERLKKISFEKYFWFSSETYLSSAGRELNAAA